MGFCTKCGKQLADGEVCGCQNQPGMPQPVTPVEPVAPTVASQQANSQPQQSVKADSSSSDFIGDIMTFFKGVFKTPADAVRTFVSKGSLIASLIILAVCAVVTTMSDILYKIIANVRYEEEVKANMSFWDPTTWVAPEPLYSTSEIALGAFGDMIFTFASAAIIAGVMYVLIKFVFEKDSEVKFGQLFAIMAIVELVQLPFSLVYTIFSYIGVSIITRVGGWISTFGSAFSSVALFVGLKDNVKNDNNMFLVYAVAAIANAVAYGLLDIIGMF